MPLFTKDNAATYGKAGAIARWEKPKPIAIPLPLPEPMPDDKSKQEALARVLRQLDRLDVLLEDAGDAKEWDMLTRAKERLAKVWFHLGGIAGPGQLRPVAPSKPKRSYTAPGSGPMPEPVQAPDTTTGSVPESQTKPSS